MPAPKYLYDLPMANAFPFWEAAEAPPVRDCIAPQQQSYERTPWSLSFCACLA